MGDDYRLSWCATARGARLRSDSCPSGRALGSVLREPHGEHTMPDGAGRSPDSMATTRMCCTNPSTVVTTTRRAKRGCEECSLTCCIAAHVATVGRRLAHDVRQRP